jgi:hypothetical protein
MLRLLDLQNCFIRTLVNDESFASLNLKIFENDFSAKQRLQIYRNNSLATLTESLENIYPAILRLVGEDFFKATARKFIIANPPVNGDLHEFGGDFADFLDKFIPAQTMPYLPSVARLEWALHQSYYAASSTLLDITRLKSVPQEKYNFIQFKLHPSHQLLDFSFPILEIWQMCQEQNTPEYSIDLSSGGQKILVIRPGLSVDMLKLTAGEFALLSALSKGEEFAEACVLALTAEPDLCIDHYLQKHLLCKHIVDFSIAESGLGGDHEQ